MVETAELVNMLKTGPKVLTIIQEIQKAELYILSRRRSAEEEVLMLTSVESNLEIGNLPGLRIQCLEIVPKLTTIKKTVQETKHLEEKEVKKS